MRAARLRPPPCLLLLSVLQCIRARRRPSPLCTCACRPFPVSPMLRHPRQEYGRNTPDLLKRKPRTCGFVTEIGFCLGSGRRSLRVRDRYQQSANHPVIARGRVAVRAGAWRGGIVLVCVAQSIASSRTLRVPFGGPRGGARGCNDEDMLLGVRE